MSDISPPDAREDLAGAINFLIAEIAEFRRDRSGRRLSEAKAAKIMGFGRSYFHNHPWQVPHYGLQGHLFSEREWRMWQEQKETTEIERRIVWDSMPPDQRRKARGVP